jgi:hypothetical protein
VQVPAPSSAEVERALARVLAETDSQEPGAVAAWLAELLDGLGLANVDIFPVFPVVAGVFIGFVLWRVARRLGGRRRAASVRPLLTAQVRERVAGLLDQAHDATRAGELVLALRLYLFALVVGLGEHGDLEFRAAWTNRELIDRGGPEPGVRAALIGLLDELDPFVFGSARPQLADVQRMRTVCESMLGAGA